LGVGCLFLTERDFFGSLLVESPVQMVVAGFRRESTVDQWVRVAAAAPSLDRSPVLLEFPGTSYRADEALAARDKGEQAEATT